MGSKFFGPVTVRLIAYLAWYVEQVPENNNFEVYLDALEESFIVVLNADSSVWVPVLYANLLNNTRIPLVMTNNEQLIRGGLNFQVQAIVGM